MNRKPLTLVILAFAAGFGAVMATRLDASAIAAVLGAVCALAFGVPVTILVTALILRYRQQARGQGRRGEMGRTPPTPMIVMPPTYPQLPYRLPWHGEEFPVEGTPLREQFPARRRFNVIGEDELD